jgi:hypothetical protein
MGAQKKKDTGKGRGGNNIQRRRAEATRRVHNATGSRIECGVPAMITFPPPSEFMGTHRWLFPRHVRELRRVRAGSSSTTSSRSSLRHVQQHYSINQQCAINQLFNQQTSSTWHCPINHQCAINQPFNPCHMNQKWNRQHYPINQQCNQ